MRLQERVGLGLEECPQCEGRHAPACPCHGLRRFWRVWKDVPARWKDVELYLLDRREDLADLFEVNRQREAIAAITSNPTRSYLLAGTHGAGKTHYLYCLYRRALLDTYLAPEYVETVPVWCVSASHLIDRASKKSQDPSAKAPEITVDLIEKLSRKGLRPRLFLDEIDK